MDEDKFTDLRREAEKRLQAQAAELNDMSPEDLQKLVYELRVHQIELELQNEELRETQQALAESRDWYADLFDFAPVGYATLDDKNVIQEANLTLAGILGIERTDLVGHTFQSYIFPEDKQTFYRHRQRLFKSKRVETCELRLRCGTKYFYFELNSQMEIMDGEDAEGNKSQNYLLRLALTDISHRKQMEERLRLLESVVVNANDAVMITEAAPIDPPGPRILYVNEGFTRMTGYTAEEAQGRSPRFLQGPKTSRESLDAMRQALIARQPIRRELLNHKKNGTTFWVETNITPVYDDAGNCTHFVAIQRDVTERKQIAQALQEHRVYLDQLVQARTEELEETNAKLRRSEERYRALFDGANHGITIFDKQGTILMINPTGAKALSATPEQCIDRSLKDFMPDKYELALENINQVIESQTPLHVEDLAELPSGEQRWYWSILQPIPPQVGLGAAVQATTYDVTTRKRMEVKLWQAHAREKQQRQLAESLREIAMILSGSLDQDEVFSKILAQLSGLIRHDGGALFVREGEALVLLRGIGLAAEAHQGERIPLTSQNPTVRAFYNAQPLIVNSGADEPHWLEWPEGDTLYAWIGAPLMVEEDVVGVLTIDRYEPDRYSEEDARILETFARQAALAIRNARLYEALRESEERFRAVWEISADALVLSDAEGIVLAANPTYLKLYGLTAEAVIGRPFNIIFPAAQREMALAQYKAVFANPATPPAFESVVHRADGSERIVESRIGFITQDGERTAMLSNIRDVTEQRRAEEALRQSEAQYRLLAENSHDGVALFEMGRISYLSPAYEKIHGRPADSLVGHDLQELIAVIHPEDQAYVATATQQQIAEQIPVQTYVYRVSHVEGHYVWVEDVTTIEYDAEGNPAKAIVNTRDVTDRKEIEEQLKTSEARQRAILEAIPDVIFRIHRDGIYLDARGPEGVTSVPVTGRLGRKIEEVLPPNLAQKVRDNVKKALATGEITHSKHEFRRDEQMRFVETRYVASGDDEVVMMMRDVTQQRHLEEQLRQSQKMEAVGQLAGGVAHHYNNLLTTIMGYVGLSLTELPGDHPIARDLERIQDTVRRAAALTRQLLAFTRKEPAKIETVNLNDLIANMEHMLDSLISSTIQLKTELAEDLAQVKIDASQFEQILVNLVVNARDAMPDGGRLLIQTANFNAKEGAEIPPGDYVRLLVQDTGHGMTGAVKARIFEPFFTTKEVGEGTGLGLSTCYAIISQHQGHITVDSEPEQGTTFKIYLPRHQTAAAPVGKSSAEALPGGQEIILLVEDDANVRELASRLLRRQGYTVYEAEDGRQALRLLEAQPTLQPDLLLTDLVMPYMSGQTLADYLAAQILGLRVLFISGYKDRLDVDDLAAWNRSFLAKPFTLAQLAQGVRLALDVEPE